MRKADWIALGVIAALSYVAVKARAGGAAASLAVHYTPNVGWVDETQGVQYDETTGNLFDQFAGSAWIGQVAAGLDGTVFGRPDVQAMITAARTGAP